MFNRYAPAAYLGIRGDIPSTDLREDMYEYVYDRTLTANQFIPDQIAIEPDSDFIWKALVVGVATGAFQVRFSDSRLYYLSNVPVHSLNLSADPANPWIVLPPMRIEAGGRIGIDITDLSAAPNTVQLVFKGSKIYRRS